MSRSPSVQTPRRRVLCVCAGVSSGPAPRASVAVAVGADSRPDSRTALRPRHGVRTALRRRPRRKRRVRGERLLCSRGHSLEAFDVAASSARVSPAGVDAARSERPLSDVWCLDVDSPPFQWTEIDISPQARRPTPRAYHAAAVSVAGGLLKNLLHFSRRRRSEPLLLLGGETQVCREGPATGMMVLFGGREQSGRSLNDAWGLRRHRNKTWDWVAAPCKKQLSPEPRFQHCNSHAANDGRERRPRVSSSVSPRGLVCLCAAVVFVGTRLVVLGGRSDSDCSK